MRRSFFRSALVLVAGVALSACTETPLATLSTKSPARQLDVQTVAVGEVVISQVYGGGGNSGATYKNDFIELFNRGTQTVDLAGWSVQYASASGTTWNATALTGTLAPGQYFLVQEAAGAGGTTALPAPDVIAPGSGIAMAGTSGKVALSQTTAALTGGCPSGGDVLDVVGYGTTSCSPASAPVLSNTTAALRNGDGCTYTGDPSADFTAGAPTPRNTTTQARTCGTVIVVGPPASVTVTPATATIVIGKSQLFTAIAQDAQNQPVPGTSFTWTSSAPSVVSVDPATGIATALQAG
ncbi:MAG TPA: lamin tail domain-containing protein, partial [Longimicrobiales bacterium]